MEKITKAIFTVDVEGHVGKDPIKSLIWGETNNGDRYGIEYLVKILNENGIKGLFFIDFAEIWSYGKYKIEEIVLYINKHGHHVGVHIHPDHMLDKKRKFLYEYSYEEQRNMIQKCTEMYCEILGFNPICFRAGKYGANLDTLDIIDKLGYKFDFSQFYGSSWCGIKPEIAYTLPQKYNNLIEFPVTIFNSFNLFGYYRLDKIDSNMNFHLFKKIVNIISNKYNGTIISLFYHSFSLLNWRQNPNNISKNKKEVRKLDKLLYWLLYVKRVDIMSVDDLIILYSKNAYLDKDSKGNIPKLKSPFLQVWFLLMFELSIFSYSKKARIFVILFFLVVLILLLAIALLLVSLKGAGL